MLYIESLVYTENQSYGSLKKWTAYLNDVYN